MSRELKDIFPGDFVQDDVLGGYPDFSHGRAESYLSGLMPDDRDLVLWYTSQGIRPLHIETHATELIKAYSIRDPHRRSVAARDIVTRELIRSQSFLEIFMRANDFPELAWFTCFLTDSFTREREPKEVLGWRVLPQSGIFPLAWQQKEAQKAHAILDHARAFTIDPNAAPDYFDQELWLRKQTESTGSFTESA